ncbi:GntR family transcriptional regulator [Phycisphaerales bacterium AB-hyl4]|uniref:GntR family transcriptional regulator n=1 Tax=Natronomicrosphaera hydrolytica TaxID=3242702 RepID=A0ABV4U5G4_9BACT
MGIKSDQVRHVILRQIRSGEFAAGEQLPSEQALADTLGVSVQTVRRGLAQLVEDQVIVKQPRVGNFVRSRASSTAARQVVLALPTYLREADSPRPSAEALLGGIGKALHWCDYAVRTMYYRHDHFAEDVGDHLAEGGFDGLLLLGHRLIPEQQIRRLLRTGPPTVLLSRDPHLLSLGVSAFYLHTAFLLESLLAGFIERGYRNIRVVQFTSSPWVGDASLVLQRYAAWLGLNFDQLVVALPNSTGRVDYTPLDDLLEPNHRPEALIVPDECVASKVFRRAYQVDCRVPDQLALAALYDSTPAIHPVPLTACDAQRGNHEVGHMAATHLHEMIEGRAKAIQVAVCEGVAWRDTVGHKRNPPVEPNLQQLERRESSGDQAGAAVSTRSSGR